MLTKPLRRMPSRSQTNNLNDFFLSQRHWHCNKKRATNCPTTCGTRTSTVSSHAAPTSLLTFLSQSEALAPKSKKCGLHGLFKKLPRTKKAHEEPLSPLQWSLSKSEALAHRQCTLAHHLNVVFQNQLIHPLLPPCNLRSHLLIQVITLITKSLDTAHNVPTFRHQLIESSGITLLLHQKHPSVR